MSNDLILKKLNRILYRKELFKDLPEFGFSNLDEYSELSRSGITIEDIKNELNGLQLKVLDGKYGNDIESFDSIFDEDDLKKSGYWLVYHSFLNRYFFVNNEGYDYCKYLIRIDLNLINENPNVKQLLRNEKIKNI